MILIVLPILLGLSGPSLRLIYVPYRQPLEISPKAISLAEVDLAMSTRSPLFPFY